MPDPRATSPQWQSMVAPYARPDLRQALWQLANSLLPFFAMWPIMFWAGRISYWLVLPLALSAGAFWIRTFIIFHDCCHGSYKAAHSTPCPGCCSGSQATSGSTTSII